jgi:inosose dehydratase
LSNTDPKHVWFVLDTGHISMAGIDPVELTKTLGHRIVEFHMKDVDPSNRGGAKSRLAVHDAMNNPVFFALGKGGVDFPSIIAHLDKIQWKGFLTVELDSSPGRPPIHAAKQSYQYITNTLKLRV